MARTTKREHLVEIATFLTSAEAPQELVEFVNGEVALIDKRKTADRKPTKTQVENQGLKDWMVAYLDDNLEDGATASELAQAADISVQKASQLLRQLIQIGAVSKTEAHGKEKARFYAA